MKTIDLNVDIAEGFPNDHALIQLASSANICCGVHAGSLSLTQETIKHCTTHNVHIGAHPGYPDPANFGRIPFKNTNLTISVIRNSLQTQLEPVLHKTAYIKPHGAFYNDATTPGPIANLLIELLQYFPLPLLGLPGTHHEQIAIQANVPFIKEGFADRAYNPQGHLLPRSNPGAILKSPAEKARQAIALAPFVDSICVHGDEPDSVETLTAVRHALELAGYTIAPT